MLSQAVTNQVGQRENQQEGHDTSRIREFLRLNPPNFTGSSVIEDPENFIEELQKVFEIMHVVDTERVELVAYQMKYVARIWFDQWKKNRVEGAPLLSWACFEKAFLGSFFHRELRKAKVRKFLTLKKDSLSVLEYNLKFTQLSRFALEMVADMRSRMSLFVVGLSRLSSREGRAAMLIEDLDIARLIIHVQQVEEEKLKDREEFQNKRAKTGKDSGQQKSNANRSSFQQKRKRASPSLAISPAPRNKGEYNSQNSQGFRAIPAHSQVSMAQRGSKPPACAKCGRIHSGMCRDGSTGCFKCGQNCHFICESVLRTGRVLLMGTIEPILLQLLHQTELHLEELLQGQAEEETACMLLRFAKSKRIRQMLSLIQGTKISIHHFVDPVEHSESFGEPPCFPEDPYLYCFGSFQLLG